VGRVILKVRIILWIIYFDMFLGLEICSKRASSFI